MHIHLQMQLRSANGLCLASNSAKHTLSPGRSQPRNSVRFGSVHRCRSGTKTKLISHFAVHSIPDTWRQAAATAQIHCSFRAQQIRPSPAFSVIKAWKNHAAGQADQLAGMAPELKEAVEEFLQKNKVVLFMKGTKQFPQCGFSNTCVQILNTMGVPYETINILEDESLRSGMKAYSQWPTFPQVYVDGEFVGGCDIMIETYQNGELREMLEVAMSS